MAPTQAVQCCIQGREGGSCKRDAFLSPFIAGSPARYRGSSLGLGGGFVEAFADIELIPDFHHLPAKFPAPPRATCMASTCQQMKSRLAGAKPAFQQRVSCSLG